ncbi:MAG TPA: citramalate synthase [Candidatus Binatia bacterium]|jgi:hydroxymethylglutaryl-CoA lyase
MSGYPRILLTEEGMRDGMQIESANIPVNDKIALLDMLSDTGLKEIAVGSFVNPTWVPQMSCIEEIIKGFHPRPGVKYVATALNERGKERIRQFIPPLSERTQGYQTAAHLCDVFAQRNTNRKQEQEIAQWPKIIESAKAAGAGDAGIGINAAWGSNWVGDFTQEQRMQMLDRQYRLWEEAGIPVERVSLYDPMGWNMPDQVERQLAAIKERWPSIHDFNLHLHNSRGVALTSVYASLKVLEHGDTLLLQPAIGGMGGCPFCGNGRGAGLVPTEDLVFMLEEMGIATGVNLEQLIQTVWRAEEIVGHPLWGHVSKSGPRPRYKNLYPMDMPFVETLDQAKHFLKGPDTYQGALSPWKRPIQSYQRPDHDGQHSQVGGDVIHRADVVDAVDRFSRS